MTYLRRKFIGVCLTRRADISLFKIFRKKLKNEGITLKTWFLNSMVNHIEQDKK